MRRALASILLALLSFPLIAPALVFHTGSGLPACCRRGGEHHCMMDSDVPAASPDQTLDARCPLFPHSSLAAAFSTQLAPGGAARIFTTRVVRLANRKPDESFFQIAPYGAAPKRGPPSLLD